MSYEYDQFLAHYGIKGQKWGERRFQNPDGSLTPEGRNRYGVGEHKDWKRLKSDAKNDAKEYAVAKAYYGNGAGTRRKRIKNLVSERMKDPDYKAEFEKQLQLQDMEKTQHKADRQRAFNTGKEKAAQTARGVKNFLLGNVVPMTTAAILIGGALKYTGAGAKIGKWASTTVNKAIGKMQGFTWKRGTRRSMRELEEQMKRWRAAMPK